MFPEMIFKMAYRLIFCENPASHPLQNFPFDRQHVNDYNFHCFLTF